MVQDTCTSFHHKKQTNKKKPHSNNTKGIQKRLENSDTTWWRNPLKGDDDQNSVKAGRNKGKPEASEVETTTAISLVNNCKH